MNGCNGDVHSVDRCTSGNHTRFEKGGSHRMPEGGHWKPERVVIIEFPDMAALNAWYSATEYQPLIALRKQCTSDQDMMFTLEGA